MRRSLPALVFLAGVLWLSAAPETEAQGCATYNPPFQGYLYGVCYSYPFNGYNFPINVPSGGNALNFGFSTLNTQIPRSAPNSALSFGFHSAAIRRTRASIAWRGRAGSAAVAAAVAG